MHQKYSYKQSVNAWVLVCQQTARMSFRTGPKKFLEDQSVQDLKIAKRTSKDLIHDVFKVEAKSKALSLFGLVCATCK